MPKDQQIDIIDEIYDLRPAQPTIDDWHIRKVSGKVPQPDTGASDEYYTPGRRRHLAILLFERRHRVRPLIVPSIDAVSVNNGRTVSGEQGDHGTRAYDSQGEPDDTSQRQAEPVLLPHGDQRVNDTGSAQQYNQPKAQSYDCKVGLHLRAVYRLELSIL